MKKNNSDITSILKYTIFILIAVIIGIVAAILVHSAFTSNDKVTEEAPAIVTKAPDTSEPENDSDKTGKQKTQTPEPSPEPTFEPAPSEKTAKSKKIIVLDPGHGKSSSLMSASEKTQSGWLQNSSGAWGEWRHWKSGTTWTDCMGSGCTGRAPSNGSCWYPIGYGDRATEPTLNLNNVLAAKKYLEQYGYEVRLTRTSNDENPSMTQRLKYCYPNMDTSKAPDADAFICIHSNAGGGKGSCYITLSGSYDQSGISSTYIDDGNRLGKLINDSIVNTTSMGAYGNGSYGGYPELILFCKSPVTIAYLEIGFFDNSNDLAILNSEYDKIGKAIADGIHAYFS